MKHPRKIVLISSIIALLFSVSCGKDDGDTIDLSNIEFAFSQSDPPIDQTIITNLANAQDPNASQIASQLSIANLMTAFLGYFQETPGAVQTTTPIGTCGGDAVVYTYTSTDGSDTYSIAYQICDSGDKYTFQVFVSVNGADFSLLVYAEETKTELKEGLMNIYAADPDEIAASTEVVLKYTWKENADGSLDYTASNDDQGFLISMKINADNSGTLSYTFDGLLSFEATWNATGTAGTFTNYDSQGNIVSSGSWPE
ncbi:MAG: hypothetical protein ABJG47_13480 [Ekhidna sp.]